MISAGFSKISYKTFIMEQMLQTTQIYWFNFA